MTHPSSKSDCSEECPLEFLQGESIQGKHPKKMVGNVEKNVFNRFCVQKMTNINL